MCVEALHADAGATDAPLGVDEVGALGHGATSTGVLLVGAPQLLGVNESFEAVHPALALETTDRRV